MYSGLFFLNYGGEHVHNYRINMLGQSVKKASGVSLDLLQSALQCRLMTVLYGIGAIVCLFGGQTFWSFSLLMCCLYARPILIWQVQNQYRNILRHFGLNGVMLTGVLLGLLGGVIMGVAFTTPAHAQFFNNAQIFANNIFKTPGQGTSAQTGSDMVGLVMNTLRLLFVMYMLFGIVQVFQAVRQGEEWKDLARTPFFVLLAGTMGDVLVGAIAGPSATTATGTGTLAVPTVPSLPR
jgi:hypothetical protein